MLRAGLEPATCRLGVDNRNRSGPQQKVRRGHEMRSGRGVEPQRRTSVQPLSPDNRAASARDDLVVGAGPPGVEPGPARLELAVLPFTPRACAERTTRIERVSSEWRPGALPSQLRPRSGTPGWSRTSGLCRRRTALSPLSYGRTKRSLRQELNPHLGRTKGACLPLTLRRLERLSREPCGSGGRLFRAHSAAAFAAATPRYSSPLASSQFPARAGSGDVGTRTRVAAVQARCSSS